MILDNLKFVKGATNSKSLLPVLSHFKIKDGRITGSNGTITMSAPFDLDMEAYPIADKFCDAVNICTKEPEITITAAGRMRFVSGSRKAFVDCAQGEYPEFLPEGERRDFKADILGQLKRLRPFVGTDASRPWINGMLIDGNHITVSNNVVICRYEAEEAITDDPINLPSGVIDEIIRLGEMPTHYQVSERSATFHYEGERWIRTALLGTGWPDVSELLARPLNDAYPLGEELLDDVREILKFTGKERRIFISPNFVATHADPEEGARILSPRELSPAIFNVDLLLKLDGVADEIDLSYYPAPCPFIGQDLKGLIVGMRYNG